MDRDDVRVQPQSSAARVLEWAEVSATDLDLCTHRPKGYRQGPGLPNARQQDK